MLGEWSHLKAEGQEHDHLRGSLRARTGKHRAQGASAKHLLEKGDPGQGGLDLSRHAKWQGSQSPEQTD